MAACSSDSTSPAAGGNTDGRLQIIPGVAALAAIDVVVDGQTRLTNAAYGVPTAPIALSLGQHQVKAVPAAVLHPFTEESGRRPSRRLESLSAP